MRTRTIIYEISQFIGDSYEGRWWGLAYFKSYSAATEYKEKYNRLFAKLKDYYMAKDDNGEPNEDIYSYTDLELDYCIKRHNIQELSEVKINEIELRN